MKDFLLKHKRSSKPITSSDNNQIIQETSESLIKEVNNNISKSVVPTSPTRNNKIIIRQINPNHKNLVTQIKIKKNQINESFHSENLKKINDEDKNKIIKGNNILTPF